MSEIDLSLVLACYNEEKIFLESVKDITKTLDNTKINYEVIFVDDCSKDKTMELIKLACKKDNKLRYIFHEKNKGRGGAVKTGFNAAKGVVAGFIDIDLETPAYHIPQLYQEVMENYDVVTGLRIYSFDITGIPRDISSIVYRKLAKLLINMQAKDSETGCKFFNRKKLLDLLPFTPNNGWFWDTEIIMAAYLNGYKIKEMPTLFIRKVKQKGSTVKLWTDSYEYFLRLLEYRKKLKEKTI